MSFPLKLKCLRSTRVEKAISTAVAESYLQGVYTRRVEKIITALGVGEISASSVSRITKELDKKVEEFISKRIGHTASILIFMYIGSRSLYTKK